MLTLCKMNAQTLDFPDRQGSFDVVILNLILSVVPDGATAFREAWRVLRPGGRAVIFDKFAAEGDSPAARAGQDHFTLGTESPIGVEGKYLRCDEGMSARSFRCSALIPIGA